MQLSVKLTLFMHKNKRLILEAQGDSTHYISAGLGIKEYFLGDVSAAVGIHKSVAIGGIEGIEYIQYLTLEIQCSTRLESISFLKPEFSKIEGIETSVAISGIVEVLSSYIFVNISQGCVF